MDWYYKAGLIFGLIWATGRALGVYGEANRELDINFLFGFMVTTGGWAAVFLVVDRIAKFLGWRPKRATPGMPDASSTSDAPAAPSGAAPEPSGVPSTAAQAGGPSRTRKRRGR